MVKIQIGQFRLANGKGPYLLDPHAVRNGRPACGRWVEEYDGDAMIFATWMGEPSEVTCRHPGCVKLANADN